jgi:hypothetical protein
MANTLFTPITKAAYVVTVTEWGADYTFTQFSGINDSAASGEYAGGTGNRIYKVVGPRTIDDVTLTAPYDPALSAGLDSIWQLYDCEELTIVVQPTTCGNNPTDLGPPFILYGCRLLSYKNGEVDRESGDVQTIELTLTVDNWSRGTASSGGEV